MGVLDFIRDTGEKLTEMGEEAKLASKIEKRILNLGVKVEGLDVDVDGEIAVLKGYPISEEDRDKAVQIAGNVWGIAKVSDRMILKGKHTRPEKPAKPLRKNVKPAESDGTKTKELRHGGKKVRPSEPTHMKTKPAKKGRRTP
ncbi:MAG: BON domain-containing protein [Candidatus Fermentibacteraceae bacterium]|nr:BON domain-containing protein [Candidatus Fermentibacteraceae bacterium]